MAAKAPVVAVVRNADGYGEVAVRVKISLEAAWDLPGESLVQVVDEWSECEYDGKRGFIKTKNLPGASGYKLDSMITVKDSYPGNSETCMRRHAEQDSSSGNVLCYVPNGPNIVKLIENWVQFKWRGHGGFIKARHAKPALGKEAATAGLAIATDGAVAAAAAPLMARKSAAASVAEPVAAPASESSASAADAAPASSEKPATMEIEASGAFAASDSATPTEPLAKKLKLGDGSPAKARRRCRYGAKCYQKNPEHRANFCHPGDGDWESAGLPSKTAPALAAKLLAASSDPPASAVDAAPSIVKAADIATPDAASAAPAGAAADASADTASASTVAPIAKAAAVPATATPGGDAVKRDCDCCFDSFAPAAGILCPGKAHFFCGACLTNFLVAFKTADYADQKKGKGRALCPMKDSEEAFSDGAIASFVPQDVFDEYLHIRIKVAEKGIQEEIESEMSSKLEELKGKLAAATGTGEQVELDKHRLKIIDDIFTLKCPRCNLAFFDYEGCSAVTCGGCKCGFCSFCLEDCGKDAHEHFYKNGSKCPNEKGPLFVEHANWQTFQNKRRANLLCKYLATIPEDLRKKVVDLIAPDAKDLGVLLPSDLSGEVLDPEAHGFIRLNLHVPRQSRFKLPKLAEPLLKKGVHLKFPEAKEPVTVEAAGTPWVLARKTPTKDQTKKNVAARLPNGHDVVIEDHWVECSCDKAKIANGFVKAKHVIGRPQPGGKGVVRDAGGHGQVLMRKQAKQDEGKNSIGFLDDNSEIKIVQHWIECTWVGAGPKSTGFLESATIPEDDVRLQAKPDECWAAAKEIAAALEVDISPCVAGGAKAKGKGKGKGKAGKAKGNG